MTQTTETRFWCSDCQLDYDEADLAIKRECSRDSCGTEFVGTERACPDCNNPFTRFIEDHCCPDCESVAELTEGAECARCDEWTPTGDGDECAKCGEPWDEDEAVSDDESSSADDKDEEASKETLPSSLPSETMGAGTEGPISALPEAIAVIQGAVAP